MTELLPATRDALLKVQTSTLTGALYRRGLRNMFMQDVNPLRIDQPRMVGIAFTMRFIPSREDKNGPGVQGQARDPASGDGGVPAGSCACHRLAR